MLLFPKHYDELNKPYIQWRKYIIYFDENDDISFIKSYKLLKNVRKRILHDEKKNVPDLSEILKPIYYMSSKF